MSLGCVDTARSNLEPKWRQETQGPQPISHYKSPAPNALFFLYSKLYIHNNASMGRGKAGMLPTVGMHPR